MGYLKGSPAPRGHAPDYNSRTDRYLANEGSPQRVLRREKKEKKRAEQEGRVHDLIVHAIQNSPTREEAAKYLAEVSGLKPEQVYNALPQETFDRVKRSSEPPKIDYKFFVDVFKKLVENGDKVAAAIMLPLVGYAVVKIGKDSSLGAAAESYEGGRAADGWGALAQDYQDLKTAMDSALADGQISVQERGQLQGKISGLQARQTQSMLNYLEWLAENQTREGGNVSVITSVSPKVILDPPETPTDFAFYSLRDQILPARDSNLAAAGVEKSTAANASSINRLAQSMKEMAQAHLKNDAAVEEMDSTKTTVGPEKVSDIGTTSEKTSAPLLKLMKQLYDANPADRDTFTEKLSDWLEAPDTWDFVSGVWKENPVQVLRAARDFYASKIAPVPYFTAVSDWAPVEKPINSPPVIDESSLGGEGTVKRGYGTDANASDADGDALTHRIISGPTGMEIDPATGEISWMPTIGQIGENRVVIGVSDGKQETTYEWIVRIASGNAKPSIEPSSVSAEGSTRYGYDSQPRATDADGDPLTYRIVRGPSGMNVDNRTGRINWRPTQNQMGEHEVVVGVSDGMDEAQYSWILQITTGNHAPEISDKDLVKIAQTRHTYAQRIIASDADNELDPQNPDSLIYKLIDAPVGMKIDPQTGWITWTPNRTETGKFNVTVEVGDGEKATRLSYQLEVSSDNKPPKILSQPQTLVKVGSRWEYAVRAEDPDNDPLIYELELNGFKVNGTDGNLSWTPEKKDTGQKSYTLRVKDSYGGSAEQAGNLTVVPNNPPQAPSVQKILLEKGRAARVSLAGIDPDNDKLSYRVEAPEGVSAEIDENGNLVLKSRSKGSGNLKVFINDGADEVAFDVPYEVKEKVITPNMLPAYLAAGVLIAGAGVGGTYGAYRVDRRVRVNQVLALDGSGRPVGSWDERGNPVSDDSGDEMLTGSMLTAIRSFVRDGLKGEVNTFDYTLPVTGRPKVKFIIEGDKNLTIAAVVGTENPKKIRRVSRALKEALREGSPAIRNWDGNTNSPKVYSIGSAVQRNIYGRELNFFDWLKELAGIDSGMEIKEYSGVPVVATPPIPAPVPRAPVTAGTTFNASQSTAKGAQAPRIVAQPYQPPPGMVLVPAATLEKAVGQLGRLKTKEQQLERAGEILERAEKEIRRLRAVAADNSKPKKERDAASGQISGIEKTLQETRRLLLGKTSGGEMPATDNYSSESQEPASSPAKGDVDVEDLLRRHGIGADNKR